MILVLDVHALISRDRRTLAKTLSAIERGEIAREDIISAFSSIEDSCLWAITGAPGVGKSSLIQQLITRLIGRKLSVAVLAVDPTSPISGGALLGDRFRVTSADDENDLFFRSLATRGNSAAIPTRVDAMVLLLQAAGFDVVLVETVGAGQAELSVAAIFDRLLLVEAPGLGDMLQAEKAGLMELADVIAVNKSDLKGADALCEDIKTSLELSAATTPPVALVCSKTGAGIPELVELLHSATLNPDRDVARLRIRLQFAWQRILLEDHRLEFILERLESGELDLDGALELIRTGDEND